MILRTLLFLVVMYFLVKVISRLFLSSNKGQKTRNSASVFFRTFQQFAEQSRQQKQNANPNRQKRQQKQPKAGSQRFEEIEEAEFEDVTEDEKSSSK